jgi:hypothetical protein
MKTLLEKTTQDEVVRRISALTEENRAEWGKMKLHQMLRHCILFEEMIAGKKKYKRSFIGILFGRMALKSILKGDKPLGRNSPTLREFKVKETGDDLEALKREWIGMLEDYAKLPASGFVHPFFGKITKDQIGYFSYKHADHHLRQFKA